MKNAGVYLKEKPEYEDYSDNIMVTSSCCAAHKKSKGCCCADRGKSCCQRLELKIK